MVSPTQWFKQRYRLLWWSLFLLSLLPCIKLGWDTYRQQLGENPLQTLQHTTGRWALTFLLLSLTITPLRQMLCHLCLFLHTHFGKRLEDWNWIIRLRRMLGLYGFFYASLHLLVYVLFDAALQWSWAMDDIREKPYIVLGVVAYLMLLPLAVTSSTYLFQIMGKQKWQRLHKTVYLILIITILHFWWQTKLGVYTPWPYTAAAVFLLGFRLLNRLGILRRYRRDDGMEVPQRSELR